MITWKTRVLWQPRFGVLCEATGDDAVDIQIRDLRVGSWYYSGSEKFEHIQADNIVLSLRTHRMTSVSKGRYQLLCT